MPSERLSPELITLPQGWIPALLRGAKGKCPRCGEAALFRKWLKPVDRCGHCRQDWSVQQADDFPAYIGIFVVGHLLAPVVIAMISGGISAWLTLAILLPVAVVMLLVTLQPTKGAVIAFLWWQGIGAFKQERREDKPGP
ncbi:MAG: hypothetical protein C0472_00710 [Erythrobacter sp.]|nr:hypothetical protein [Erythrobacter sp.]